MHEINKIVQKQQNVKMAIANLMKPCNKTICPQMANHSIGTHSVLSLHNII